MEQQNGETSSRRGLAGDLDRVRHGTRATAAELRAFLAELRGKPPEQVLGAIAQSHLMQGVFVSTILHLIVLVICTAVPYAWAQAYPPPPPKPKPAAEAAAAAPAAATADPATAAAKTAPATDEERAKKVSEALGESDVKVADPDENPRDTDLDSLLDE